MTILRKLTLAALLLVTAPVWRLAIALLGIFFASLLIIGAFKNQP
jgi:hypothetical protein